MKNKETILMAVFDILGFSSRVRNSSLDDVLKTYGQLRQNTTDNYELWSFDLMHVDEVQVPAILRLHVQSVVFSDSVFAWVPLKRGFSNPFIKWCCEFICQGLGMNVPIRGAISAGEAILDTETSYYIGQPILDAHELEENLNWIGLAFSHQATWPPLIADISPKLLMEYQVPVKKGQIAPLSADWPRVWRERHGECASRKLRSLSAMQPDKVKLYYENAALFAEHSLKRQNWFNEEPTPNAFLQMRPYSEVRDQTLSAEARRNDTSQQLPMKEEASGDTNLRLHSDAPKGGA